MGCELGEDIPDFEVIGKLSENDFADYICDKLRTADDLKEVILQKMGVMVFETHCTLSIFHKKLPIILLNEKDSEDEKLFSLFCELAGLLLGDGAGEKEFCRNVACEIMERFKGLKLGESNLKAINYNGRAYLKTVLKALRKGIIARWEFYKYTGCERKYIDDIEYELGDY